jgi:hypothetical protein
MAARLVCGRENPTCFGVLQTQQNEYAYGIYHARHIRIPADYPSCAETGTNALGYSAASAFLLKNLFSPTFFS